MSKYNHDPAYSKEYYLSVIANELAEANRLRRVAIELELIKLIDPAQVATFVFDKDEDLA